MSETPNGPLPFFEGNNFRVAAKQLIAFLAGKKTYLVSIAGIVYAIGIGRNWWPGDIQIWGILGGTGAMTLRAAIAKLLAEVVTPDPIVAVNKQNENLPQNAP